MARDNALFVVSADGRAYVNALGATAPTNATTVPSGWSGGDLGWIHEDGLTQDYSEDRTEFGAWGTKATLRIVSTKVTRSFKVIALENSPLVMALYYKISTPTPDANGAFDFPLNDSGGQDLRSWIFDTVDGDKVIRYYVPTGEITARETITHNQSTRTAYSFTISPYPDDNGDSAHVFVEMPTLAA